MVVDIRDYTPLARSVPEALLSQAIGTWFLRVGQIVQQQGSWAQKYIGDAVMCGVGASRRSGRARRPAARALVRGRDRRSDRCHASRSSPAWPLRIGAGVNTGPAIIGGVDYTALGDTVNAAFRLETATKQLGLGVAIGERTFSGLPPVLQSRFEQRKVALKGYEGESTAWGISFEGLRAGLV